MLLFYTISMYGTIEDGILKISYDSSGWIDDADVSAANVGQVEVLFPESQFFDVELDDGLITILPKPGVYLDDVKTFSSVTEWFEDMYSVMFDLREALRLTNVPLENYFQSFVV